MGELVILKHPNSTYITEPKHCPGYAKDHQPCVIFMDEIDAIGGRRFSQGTSADREIQRTLMEVSMLTHLQVSGLIFTKVLSRDGAPTPP